MSGTTGSTETISTTSNQLKTTSGGYVRTYAYDAAGNTLSYASNTYTFNQRGRMSSASTGTLIQETVWLGDTPVATLRPSGSTIAIYYVHTDHLGNPRKVTRPSDNGLMWRWDPDTFGRGIGRH